MARQRRNTRPLDDLPTLFDDLKIDFTRSDFDKDKGIHGHVNRRNPVENPLAAEGIRPIVPKESPTDRLMFMSFGSGSSGNCSYIGNGKTGILIDAGVDPDRVKEKMKANGLDYSGLKGIILTHDHGDHVRYAYQILRKQKNILLYSTPKTLNGMLRRHSISSRIKDYHKPIYKEHPFEAGGMEITAFETSHDGTDNMGFFIKYGPHHTFAVMTDTGTVTERADFYLRQARYVMIESNYDAHMLATGPYTEFLKSRISSATGHLGNAEAATYVAEIYTPTLKNIFLCHLSADNNTPELALESMKKALEEKGITVGNGSNSFEDNKAMVQLVVLPRYDASNLYLFREPQSPTL